MRVDCRMAVTISGFQYWRLRKAARAPALSNVQTFALYFNFATLNIPSPPTSSAPALSPSRRVCNNSLIPGDESPVESPHYPLSLLPLSGKCTSIKPRVWFGATQDAPIIIDKSLVVWFASAADSVTRFPLARIAFSRKQYNPSMIHKYLLYLKFFRTA